MLFAIVCVVSRYMRNQSVFSVRQAILTVLSRVQVPYILIVFPSPTSPLKWLLFLSSTYNKGTRMEMHETAIIKALLIDKMRLEALPLDCRDSITFLSRFRYLSGRKCWKRSVAIHLPFCRGSDTFSWSTLLYSSVVTWVCMALQVMFLWMLLQLSSIAVLVLAYVLLLLLSLNGDLSLALFSPFNDCELLFMANILFQTPIGSSMSFYAWTSALCSVCWLDSATNSLTLFLFSFDALTYLSLSLYFSIGNNRHRFINRRDA